MRKHNRKYLLMFSLTALLILFGFYLYIANGFAKSAIKTIEAVHGLQKEWKSEGINPVDSIQKVVIKVLDSTHNKDSLIMIRKKNIRASIKQ